MIKASEFKKHIAKPFGKEMRLHGFKGSGFIYKKETDDYIFAIWIENSRWGGRCSPGFAIHPKAVIEEYNGPRDLKKLKDYQFEWRMGLEIEPPGISYPYSDSEVENLITLGAILKEIKEKAFPVINQFETRQSFVDLFQVSEMEDFWNNLEKRTGVSVVTSEARFAWAMALTLEKSDPERAKQFANWVYSQDEVDEDDEEWFGMKDVRRILNVK